MQQLIQYTQLSSFIKSIEQRELAKVILFGAPMTIGRFKTGTRLVHKGLEMHLWA